MEIKNVEWNWIFLYYLGSWQERDEQEEESLKRKHEEWDEIIKWNESSQVEELKSFWVIIKKGKVRVD